MGYYPRSDILQNEIGLVFEISVPGLDSTNVTVEFTNNNLIVSGYHKERNKHFRYTSRELYTGSFVRKYIINTQKFDVNKITSSIVNGLLTIQIPYKDKLNISKIDKINIEDK